MRGALAAIRHVEAVVPAATPATGIVLRYGNFYGPGTGLSQEPDVPMTAVVRKRLLPVIGSGDGVWSFVHIEDAATATAAAIERGDAGIYQVVDDEPAAVRVWLPALAAALGAPAPLRLPRWLGRLPDARAKRAAQSCNPDTGDLHNLAVQRTLRGAGIALRLNQIGPHLGPTVVVVIAEYPVHVDAAVEQRRRQVVQGAVALQVAEQDGCLGQGIERGQAALDELPLLVDVADEDNRHGFGRSLSRGPDLDDVAAASLAFHEYPQMETG